MNNKKYFLDQIKSVMNHCLIIKIVSSFWYGMKKWKLKFFQYFFLKSELQKMDNIINIFKSTFLFKEDVDTDNLVFKIITKISVGICVSCALLVAATQGNFVYTKKKLA